MIVCMQLSPYIEDMQMQSGPKHDLIEDSDDFVISETAQGSFQ